MRTIRIITNEQLHVNWDSFRGERVGTPFALLRMHCGRHCERLSGPKCTISCGSLHRGLQSQFFPGDNTPVPTQKRCRCLDPDTSFRMARQYSNFSCFTKRPLLYRVFWQIFVRLIPSSNIDQFSNFFSLLESGENL